MSGPIPYPESPYPEAPSEQQFPPQGTPLTPASYPGSLPPPVEYPKPPKRSRWLPITLGLLIVAVIAAVVAAIVFAERSSDGGVTALNPDTAKTAIQKYLDALAQGDDEAIARNASCGLFDAIKDKQPDMSLAKLAGDVFRRQFDSVQVESVDKIVSVSENQAQALFTMKAKLAHGGSGVDRQAVAQLLVQGNDILVCSYLPRSAGPF
jgi:hypothetical protein